MADIKSPEARSRNMAKIRSKDTKPEEFIRKELFRRGYRYRKNTNTVFGHPDAWLPKYGTAVFINGCFWHRHCGCKYAYMPKSRVDFWTEKFKKNIERDRVVKDELKQTGIKMLIVWECTIRQMMKSESRKNDVMKEIESFFRNEDLFFEI